LEFQIENFFEKLQTWKSARFANLGKCEISKFWEILSSCEKGKMTELGKFEKSESQIADERLLFSQVNIG